MADAEVIMNVLAAAEEADRRQEAVEKRRMRDVNNPFDLSDNKFYSKFRLNKGCVRYLCEELTPRLKRYRRHGLSVETQVFAALRFYSRGSYQQEVGDNILVSISQPAVSRVVKEVSTAIYDILGHRWIKFPDTEENRKFIKKRFYDGRRFKGVLGCIDCSHIKIVRPYQNEEAYVNHKGFHSLNVQVIGSHDLEILSINSRFPGSVHDSFIWRYSSARDEMKRLWDNGDRSSWLLGDSVYPLEPWLMTPITDTEEGTPKQRYTDAHCQTRNCMERLFWTWKNTFRCLLSDRVLHYQPISAGKIIIACAVLHNMRRRHKAAQAFHSSESDDTGDSDEDNDVEGVEMERVGPDIDRAPIEGEGAVLGERLTEGARVRRRIVRDNFSNVEK